MTENESSVGRGARTGVARARYLPVHFVKRYWWAVTARSLSADTSAWVASILIEQEFRLFRQMSASDQRHHVQVARRLERRLGGEVPRAWLAAALLHDVGKLVCGLGTGGRVLATLFGRRHRGDGRIARYYRHEAIGASLLLASGSDPETVALVGHWPDAPVRALTALGWADDL